jgi:hypothetical protein
MLDTKAVLLNGVYGVGKSTVLVEMADRLEAAGVRYAALDLDWLGWAWSDDEGMDAADHPTASPLLLEHLELVMGNLRRRGNDRYALAGSIASEAELARIRETLAMPLRVVLLTAPLDVVRARLGEEPTAGRAADAARTHPWATGDHGPLTVPADLVVDADRPVGELAAEILDALGWVGPGP